MEWERRGGTGDRVEFCSSCLKWFWVHRLVADFETQIEERLKFMSFVKDQFYLLIYRWKTIQYIRHLTTHQMLFTNKIRTKYLHLLDRPLVYWSEMFGIGMGQLHFQSQSILYGQLDVINSQLCPGPHDNRKTSGRERGEEKGKERWSDGSFSARLNSDQATEIWSQESSKHTHTHTQTHQSKDASTYTERAWEREREREREICRFLRADQCVNCV